MKLKLIGAAALITLASGCTSWDALTPAHSKGYYYLTSNLHFFGVHPNIQLCKANKYGDLDCSDVDVKD